MTDTSQNSSVETTGNGFRSEEHISSSVLLTPECQDLWLVSPKLLFLYDQVVIDEQDLNSIIHPDRDTRFAAMKARSAEKLVEWDFLVSIDYRDRLPADSRAEVFRIAKEIVESYLPHEGQPLEESRFYRLSVYTHEKYAAYLEQNIYACPSQDEAELRRHVTRLQELQSRLDRLRTGNIDDTLCLELAWTLERIAAKAVAGLLISRNTSMPRIYDTDEYSPFIQDALAATPSAVTVFHPDGQLPALTASVAALSRKSLPEVSIADEYRLFSSVRDKAEFIRLRRTLRDLESFFGDLLKERSDTVRRKLGIEVDRLAAELNERFDEARNSLGQQTKWIGIEMLAGQIAGFLSPWIDIAKDSSRAEKLEDLRSGFLSRQDIAGNLFMLMEIWGRHRILDDEKYRQVIKERDKDTIWGQDKTAIPWYETSPSKITGNDNR